MDNTETFFLPHTQLQMLIESLQQQGYRCVGPQVRDGAIMYDTLTRAEQLPWGIRDHQAPGSYRLEKIPQQEAFSWANGPQAIKPILFKTSETVWKVSRDSEGKLSFLPNTAEETPVAIFGARACDLAGMAIQDKVFVSGQYVDERYKKRRENLFVIAVNCTYSSNNCFCVSAGTGPEVTHSYDVLMTELTDGFTVFSGSDKGKNLLTQLKLSLAQSTQIHSARERVTQAANMQTKRIPLDNKKGLRDLLFSNLDHPRWTEVANRCLSCGNCTSVCPTCFCHTQADQPNMDTSESTQEKMWDSCFSEEHSYITGKVIRDDTRKRYRQWLTHKVGSWFDQFGTSGCIGCGRCITWCPVGIDITEELAAISGESNKRHSDE